MVIKIWLVKDLNGVHKALTSAAHLWDQLEHRTWRDCKPDFTDAHVIEWAQIPKSRFVMFHNQLKAFADKWRLLYQPTPYYCPWFQGMIFNMHTQKWLCAHTIGHSALHTAWIMLPMSVQLQFLEWLIMSASIICQYLLKSILPSTWAMVPLALIVSPPQSIISPPHA